MATISAKGMRFYAHHGYSAEERALGADYEVDVMVKSDFAEALAEDALDKTVNYESIFLLVKYEMSVPTDFLEQVADRIIKAIQETFVNIEASKVRIARLAPALGENVKSAYIEVSSSGKTVVGLEKLRMYAYHGYYEEENQLGNYYQLDIEIECPTVHAKQDGGLMPILNYESIFWAIKHEMSIPSKLLEHVLGRILNNLKGQFVKMRSCKLTIAKQRPPVSGVMGQSSVTMEEDYKTHCARCKQPMACYKDTNCWCKQVKVSEATLEMLNAAYQGCVCKECLLFFKNGGRG